MSEDTLAFLTPGGGLQGLLARRLFEMSPDLHEGERVGPYRLVRELGRGGMAVVYLAERVEGDFSQNVALKCMHAGFATAEGEALFRRERQILAALEHPNIARLLDGGQREDGRPWFALERVQGEPIDRYCHERALSRSARIALFRDVLRAVEFAHARRLVHCDIKPSNILVTHAGLVKLLDFGIAAFEQQEGAPRALTPGFASPEQHRGESATTASDIWQLGRLLQRLFSGDASSALEGETRLRPAQDATADADVRVDDRDIGAIVAKACAQDPADRYRSVGELDDDLARLLAHRPLLARGHRRIYVLACYARRHAMALLLGGAALCVLAALVIGFTWRVVQERNRAEAAARLAQQQSDKATRAVNFLSDLLSQADPFVNAGHGQDVPQVLEQGATRLATELQDQPDLKVELLQLFGRIYANRDDDAHAVPLFEAALELLHRTAPPHDVRLAEAAQRLAASLPRSQNARSVQLLEDASSIAQANADTRRLARLARLRAVLVYEGGDLGKAAQLGVEAVALNREAYGEDSAQYADNLLNLGAYHDELGDSAVARDEFERAYRIYQRVHGANHPDTLMAEGNLAQGLRSAKEFVAADNLLADVLARTAKLYGEDGPRYAKRLNDLGLLRLAQGRLDEAAANFSRALAQFDRAGPGNDLDSLSSQEGLARVALAREDYAGALLLLRQWQQRKDAGAVSVDLDLGSEALAYARACIGLHRWDEAESALARAEIALEKMPPQQPQKVELGVVRKSLAAARLDTDKK